MVNFVNNLSENIEKLVVFIKKPSCIPIFKTNGMLVLAFFVLSFAVGQKLHLFMISKIIKNIALVYIFLIIYLGTFDKYFREFSHRSYLNGVLFLAILTAAILLSLVSFGAEHFFVFVCINLSVYSIYWFCYHIITKKTSLKLIKLRIKFYLAMGGSFSYIVLIVSNDIQQLKVMVTSFILSFAWINYFIEAFEQNNEKKEGVLWKD